MKKFIPFVVLLFMSLGTINLYAQKINQDTLVYQTITDFRLDTTAFIRHNFVDRAASYDGKSFAQLMDDLNLCPMIMGIGYSFGESGERLFSSIRLYIPINNNARSFIHVSWEEPVSMPLTAERLLRKNGMYKWMDDYVAIFADYKIGRVVTNIREH